MDNTPERVNHTAGRLVVSWCM